MQKTEKIFPPSKYIKDALEARGWTQTDLAFITGRNPKDISDLVLDRRKISPEISQELAAVFGTEADYWLSLDNKFRLAQTDYVDEAIIKRSQLFGNFPAKEMIKRGWIEPTDKAEELEEKFLQFFDIKSLNETPNIHYAAKKSNSYTETTITQAAWIRRAFQLAKAVMVKKFSDEALAVAMAKLYILLADAEEIRHVPKILADAGIRLLIIEPLPNTKIDGVCFWLDGNSPVIVLSMRFDRIDGFWHTLMHELSHVKNREGQDAPIIDELIGEEANSKDKPEFEIRADKDAAEFSIPAGKLDNFILRVQPTYSETKVLGFAARWQVHAGLVVGQLQHKGNIPYSQHRKFLVKVRHIITSSALTDGWGNQHSIFM